MVDVPRRGPDREGKKQRRSFSSEIFDIFMMTYDEFVKLSSTEKQRYNTGWLSMQEIFYQYFISKHGYDLASKIDSAELPVYFDTIKKKGYTFNEILDKASQLHNDMKPSRAELSIINDVLTRFETFVNDLWTTNPALVTLYTDFATFAHLNPSPNYIGGWSRIKNVEHLYKVWDDFLNANPTIVLSDKQKEDAQHILEQGLLEADLTEKIYVQTIISQISRILQAPQKWAFDTFFHDLDALGSPYDSISKFKTEWEFFLTTNGPLTPQVQQSLDALKIDFSHIKNQLISRGIATDSDFKENISKWNDTIKKIFGKILVPKVFDDASESKEFYTTTVEKIKDIFTWFPPYLNQFMKIYPYRESDYSTDVDVVRYLDDIRTRKLALEDKNVSSIDKSRLEAEILELGHDLNNRRWHLYADYIKTQDPVIWQIFKRLVENNFDFSKISDADKKELMVKLTSAYFKKMQESQVLDYLWLSFSDFEAFVNQMMDISQDTLTIPTPGWSLDLRFARDEHGKPKKTIMGWWYEQLPKIADMSKIKNLPMSFTFDASAGNRDFFENSPLFSDLFYEVDGQKIAESYKITLVAPDGTKIGPGYLSSVGKSWGKGDSGDSLYFFTKPLNTIDGEWERKQIYYNGDPVTIDVWDDVSNTFHVEIDDADKELTLTGNQIGQLLLWYTIWKTNEARPHMTQEEKEDLEERIGGDFEGFKDTEKNNPWSQKEEDSGSEEEEKDRETLFNESFKALKGYKWAFRPWVRFVWRFKDSVYSGEWWRWVEFEVVKDLWDKMKIKLSGVDFPLDSSIEGKIHTVDKTADMLDHWSKKSFGDWFFVVGKQKDGKEGFQEQKKALEDAGINKKWMDVFNTHIGFDGSRFVLQDDRMGKEWQEITHFENETMRCDIKKKNNGEFQVNIDFDDMDENGENVKYKHTQTMDYYQFMLFVAENVLMPVSKEQLTMRELAEKQQQATWWSQRRKRKWYSFNHIKWFAKWLIKGIKDKREKRIEEWTEDLTDWLVGEKGVYRMLASILPGNMGESFNLMDMEHQEQREENIKKKIETWKERIEKTPDRWAKTWYHIHVEPLIDSGNGMADPYKTAGAMLAMINKWWLYMWGRLRPGDWVKIMFGPQVYGQFMQYYMKKKQLIESARTGVDVPWSVPYIEELWKLEVSFINDILSQWDMWFGKTPEEKTAYSKQQRKVWSKWFGEELESSFEKERWKAEFEKKVEEMGAISYEYAESQYLELIGLGAYQKAFPYFKAMLNNTKNWVHVRKNAMYATSAILSGVFQNTCSGKVMWIFYDVAKSNLYAPLSFIKDPRSSLYMKTLLDLLTDNSFSQFMASKGYHLDDFSLLDVKKSESFIKDFTIWWNTDGHGKQVLHDLDAENFKIHDLLKRKDLTDIQRDTLKKIMDQWQEDNAEWLDDKIANNPAHYMKVSGINMDKSMIAPHLNIKNGRFDKWHSRLVWGVDIPQAIKVEDLSAHPWSLAFTAKKFLTYFEFLDVKFFMRALATAQQKIASGDTASAEDILEYMIRWQVIGHYGKIPPEMNKTLKKFKSFFVVNLRNFDTDIAKDMWWDDAVKDFSHPYKYGDMGEYRILKNQTLNRNNPDFAKRMEWSSDDYINSKLYDIEQTLKRKHMEWVLELHTKSKENKKNTHSLPGVNVGGRVDFGIAA